MIPQKMSHKTITQHNCFQHW